MIKTKNETVFYFLGPIIGYLRVKVVNIESYYYYYYYTEKERGNPEYFPSVQSQKVEISPGSPTFTKVKICDVTKRIIFKVSFIFQDFFFLFPITP